MRSRSLAPLTLLAALIGALTLGCSGDAAQTGLSIGLLRFSVEVLKSDAAGRPVFPPELTVAYCSVPVWVPDGPRRSIASSNGMVVEVSWDKVRPTRQSSGGALAVEFKNFRWSLKNNIRCGVSSLSAVIPTVQPTLTVTTGLTPLKPAMRASDSAADPAWKKGLYGMLCVSWSPGLPSNVEDIDILKRYQAARPELTRPAAAPVRRPGFPR